MSIVKSNIISWILVCLGWGVTSYLAYLFGVKRYSNERAEQVFEEVSVIIESAQEISDALMKSFGEKEAPIRREGLWRQYEELQYRYYGNRSRCQFLLDKYFGREIATKVYDIMEKKFPEASREACEAGKYFPEDLVGYFEQWTGEGSQDPLGESDGYKWKMMAKCGMDVAPYIKEIRRLQSGTEAGK